MLVALVAHPFMVWSYSYVYNNYERSYYNGRYIYDKNTFLRFNGGFIYAISTFFAAYFVFCIINGITMIKNGQKDRIPSKFNFEKLITFETFFGFLSLETGAIVIATISVILGIAFMILLCLTSPYYLYGFYNIG